MRDEKNEGEVGGAERNRTADEGFADPCLTTWLPRHPVLHAKPKPRKRKTHLPGLPAVGCESSGLNMITRASAFPHQKTPMRNNYSNK